MNLELIQYLQKQILTADDRLKHFTHGASGIKYPHRFLFVKLEKYIKDFLSKTSKNRMVVIPGFRGVGKTTIMAQICQVFKEKGERTLFISVEDLKNPILRQSRRL